MNAAKWISTRLPLRVREQLQAAARVDPRAPPGESLARTRELDAVLARTKRQYPEFFINQEREVSRVWEHP